MCVSGLGDRQAHAKASLSLSRAQRNWKAVFTKKKKKKERNYLPSFALPAQLNTMVFCSQMLVEFYLQPLWTETL